MRENFTLYIHFSYRRTVLINPMLREKGMATLYLTLTKIFRSYSQDRAGIAETFAVDLTKRTSQESHIGGTLL